MWSKAACRCAVAEADAAISPKGIGTGYSAAESTQGGASKLAHSIVDAFARNGIFCGVKQVAALRRRKQMLPLRPNPSGHTNALPNLECGGKAKRRHRFAQTRRSTRGFQATSAQEILCGVKRLAAVRRPKQMLPFRPDPSGHTNALPNLECGGKSKRRHRFALTRRVSI